MKEYIDKHKSVPFCLVGKDGKFVARMDAERVLIPPGPYRVMVNPFPGSNVIGKIAKESTDPMGTTIELVVPRRGSTDLTIRLDP